MTSIQSSIAKPKRFYITTTLPYVNSEPHIGTAMEMIRADVIARYKRYLGYEVFFNTGTDEHGQKIYEGAAKEGLTTQAYVDKNSEKFKSFHQMANISYDAFIRTTDNKHKAAAQKMWNICLNNGDIYKAKQTINYCVGCEMEKTDSELLEGKCPDHPNRDLVISEEENYFFKFSKYGERLLELYTDNESHNELVLPDFRQNEIRKFVEGGLHDFSVSRLKSKMPWGVEVPGDSDHVMYVWFDALTSYIATLDWATYDNPMNSDERVNSNFEKFWLQSDCENREVVQYCGKDNNKAQSAIWQAMLMSAGILPTSKIVINGHIISGGIKMSKSIGNVISPFEIVEEYNKVTEYSEEVLRFVMCHEVSTHEDSDITVSSIRQAYSAYLQNGIGNQVNRILKLTSQYLNSEDIKNIISKLESSKLDNVYTGYLDNFKINEAIHIVTDKVKSLDEYIQSKAPFKLIKSESQIDKDEAKAVMRDCLYMLGDMSHHLYFFMPRTAMVIYNAINTNTMPEKALFNRTE